jgi:hypothetical protein
MEEEVMQEVEEEEHLADYEAVTTVVVKVMGACLVADKETVVEVG